MKRCELESREKEKNIEREKGRKDCLWDLNAI